MRVLKFKLQHAFVSALIRSPNIDVGVGAVGLGTLYLSSYSATQIHHLLPGSLALVLILVTTAVGASLREMPLFLTPDVCVRVPLEATCCSAFDGMPEFWRAVLENSSNS